MKTKKEIKKLKKEICNVSAINIGYYTSILEKIPSYALIGAIKKIDAANLTDKQNDKNIENILITESVREMNYQHFKKLTPYFF